MPPTAHQRHPAIEAALQTAATLLGMEVVFISSLDAETFRFDFVHGDLPGVTEGCCLPRTDSMCHRLLAGAPSMTADAAAEPAYRDVPAREAFGIVSYVGVPIHDPGGRVVGTLCGLDRGQVSVDAAVVGVLEELAEIIGRRLHPEPPPGSDLLLRRCAGGWSVHGETADDLLGAMVLADLLAADLEPGVRPPRPTEQMSEVDQLRLAVQQLEHALAARVLVEQAIGVLAERNRMTSRQAFERLRRAARSRGRRVHDLSREVVASATDPAVPLPPELHRRR